MTVEEQGDLWSVAPQAWAEHAERRNEPLFAAVFDRVGVAPGTRLLDVGCGSGLAAALAADLGAIVTALDAAEALLAYARGRGSCARFVAGDLERLPFPDGSFDVVTAFNAMPYADDLGRALSELRRVVAPDGIVVVTAGAGDEQARCAAGIAQLSERPPARDRVAADLADPHAAALAVEQAGLTVVDVHEVAFDVRFAGLDEAVSAQLAAGPVEAAVRRAGRDAVVDALRAYFRPLTEDDGAVTMPVAFRVVLATTPVDETKGEQAFPPVVGQEEFDAAHERLLAKEKQATYALDALAAERRRQPVVPVDAGHVFDSPDGERTLLELFEGHRQLVVYHFMGRSPDPEPCAGCCSFTDNVGDLVHLGARDTRFVVVSRHDVEEQQRLRRRFGWTVPFFSAARNRFSEELGVGGGFALSVFVRDEDRVFRSYWTSGRGVDRLRLDFSLLDLTPFGRQEAWEDSPDGWPQMPTMAWLRRKDAY